MTKLRALLTLHPMADESLYVEVCAHERPAGGKGAHLLVSDAGGRIVVPLTETEASLVAEAITLALNRTPDA